MVSWKFGNNYVYPTKQVSQILLYHYYNFQFILFNQWDAELDLLMVPSGELHIAAVDYSHTHHPYFCIVKHRS